MARSLLLLLAGAIAGSGLALLSMERFGAGPAVESSAVLPVMPIENDARGFEGTRLAAYEQAARTTSPAELESAIATAAALPRSREREMRLEALIARLAELDLRRAARFGETLTLETRLLAPVYRSLALTDEAAALAQVARVQSAVRQRAFALAVLEALGNDPDRVALVADVLPAASRFSFELDALVARARQDPDGALTAVLERDNVMPQQLVIPALASVMVSVDPAAALLRRDLIAEDLLRESYAAAVLTAWAEQSPASLFEFLETERPTEILGEYSLVSAIAKAAPDRALGLAAGLPRGVRYDLQFAALTALADRDAAAALTRLRALGTGRDETALSGAIASAYGRQNPVAAAAWAFSLSPPSPAVRGGVLQGIADVDYDYAVDLVLSEIDRDADGFARNSSTLLTFVTRRGGNPGRLLDRLLEAAPESDAQQVVTRVTSTWSQVDPEAAAAWVLGKGDALDPSVVSDVVRNLARDNPEAASRALAAVPPERREGWITGIAAELGRMNPDGAIAFLEPYRGQPDYAAGFGEVLSALAPVDPARAGRLLAESGVAVPTDATLAIASMWVQRDADAATRWAVNLRNERMRASAIAGLAMTLTTRDPEAGLRWVLDLPEGPQRDAGLNALLMRRSNSSLDRRVLDAYSSDSARQEGVVRLALLLARGDPDESRWLLETRVTDVDLRLEIEDQIARPGGPGIDPMSLIAGEPIR